MPTPTDRGHVAVTTDAAGRPTVMVGTRLADGNLQDVFAMHVGPDVINVHPGVSMVDGPSGRCSTDVVEVFESPTGTVNIRRLDPAGDLRNLPVSG